MGTKYKIGIVGCGMVPTVFHLLIFKRTINAQVVADADLDTETLENCTG